MDIYEIKQKRKIVSERIGKEVDSSNFVLSIDYLKTIHEKLFKDIFADAGKFRNFNMSKRELILNGDSVVYSDCRNMYQDLFKAIISEYKLDYKNMDIYDVVKHISSFTSQVWHAHPFADGNTRTTAVYVQEYLHSLGFNVSNEIFKSEYIYFRNALVKANYNNPEFLIYGDISPLEKFFTKVLVDRNIELDLKDVYIDGIVKLTDSKRKKS